MRIVHTNMRIEINNMIIFFNKNENSHIKVIIITNYMRIVI